LKLTLKYGLPFVKANIKNNEKEIKLSNVLIDTGSAQCIFSSDKLEEIDVILEPNDPIHRINGVGGSEFVFKKNIQILIIDDMEVNDFSIELETMEYGFEIDGIIGMSFL